MVSSGPKLGIFGWGFGGFLTFLLLLVALLTVFDDPTSTDPGSGIVPSEDLPPWAGRTPSGRSVASSEVAGCDGGSESASEPAPIGGDIVPAAGAQLIGGGGSINPEAAPPSTTECVGVTGLDLTDASAVAVDRDGGVWVHWSGSGPPSNTLGGGESTVVRTLDDQIDAVRETRDPGWLVTTPGGDVVLTVRGAEQVSVLGRDQADDRVIEVPGDATSTRAASNPLRGGVEALVVTADGGILAARRDGIFVLAPEGARHLVGGFRAVDDAEIRVDGIEGQIQSLVVLPDDRVAFLTTQTGDDGGGPLYLLDSDEVRTIDVRQRRDRELAAILPGPEGALLAISAGPQTHPQIQTIDVETGEIETVAELDGVMPHPDGPGGVAGALSPVSAAADGDDLILLADGLLWRLPDAFG
jgi:hypothetical protein